MYKVWTSAAKWRSGSWNELNEAFTYQFSPLLLIALACQPYPYSAITSMHCGEVVLIFFSSNFSCGPVKDVSNQTSLLKILQANGFVLKSYTSMRVFIDAFRVIHMVYFRVLECKSDLIRLTCPLIYSAGCCRGQVLHVATSRLLVWELMVLLYLSLSLSTAR